MSRDATAGIPIHRHSAVVRVTHWINVVCLALLLMSGLQIFNAHPALYWGEDSDFERPLVSIYWASGPDGRPTGITNILGRRFDTTGVLGWSWINGRPVQRAFPAWLTIPSAQDLATGRVWHLFFAWLFAINGLVYIGHSIVTGRFRRDLLPTRAELGRIGATLRQHLMLRFHQHTERYNVIQGLTYVVVIVVLAPIAVLTGLTMSPAIVAAAPWLLDVFGGRQSARTIHFVATWMFVLFAAMHVAMVLTTGFVKNMRSMITGWYRVSE